MKKLVALGVSIPADLRTQENREAMCQSIQALLLAVIREKIKVQVNPFSEDYVRVEMFRWVEVQENIGA